MRWVVLWINRRVNLMFIITKWKLFLFILNILLEHILFFQCHNSSLTYVLPFKVILLEKNRFKVSLTSLANTV